jgi:hypothetical protein
MDGAMHDRLQAAPTTAESDAAARWIAVEGRVYPLVMSDPDLYELVVGLVVEARDILRTECVTVADLVSSDAEAVLSRCPSRQAVGSGGFDTKAAFDAARAQRFRELSPS